MNVSLIGRHETLYGSYLLMFPLIDTNDYDDYGFVHVGMIVIIQWYVTVVSSRQYRFILSFVAMKLSNFNYSRSTVVTLIFFVLIQAILLILINSSFLELIERIVLKYCNA